MSAIESIWHCLLHTFLVASPGHCWKDLVQHLQGGTPDSCGWDARRCIAQSPPPMAMADFSNAFSYLAAAAPEEQAELATQQEQQQHQSQQEAAEPMEQEPEPDQAEEEPEQASPQPAVRAPKRKQSVKPEPAVEEAPRLQRRARKRNAAVAAAIEAEEWKSDADEENSEEEAGRVLC